MVFVDMNDGRKFTAADLKRDWTKSRDEEPYNHAPTFCAEYLEIILATINGRNDLDFIGPTPREVSEIVRRLRERAM